LGILLIISIREKNKELSRVSEILLYEEEFFRIKNISAKNL
jgi:hypothetical protein